MLAAVAESFDDVIVSLDGPREIHDTIRRVEGAFALLETGVRALRDVRSDMRITARTTVQQANHRSLLETARPAGKLSLDGISFLAVDVTSTAFNRALAWPKSRQTEIGLSLPELTALENEIDKADSRQPRGVCRRLHRGIARQTVANCASLSQPIGFGVKRISGMQCSVGFGSD